MTNINATMLAAGALASRQIADGLQLQVAAGIMGQFLNPLNAGRNGFGMLPELMMLRCFAGCNPGTIFQPPLCGTDLPRCTLPAPEPVQQWTAQTTGEGRAEVDLGDGYTLKFNERSSQIEIFNANTGEHTRVWGDPHVDVDGKRAFDFWGTTTFTLENGTKITINTEQWKGNSNAYVASQVVVTKGANALVVDGISQNQLGDLKMTMSTNGQAVDAAHRDGYVLHENGDGASWLSEHTGDVATQQDLNATRVGREYGPGSMAPALSELMPQIGQFLMFGALMNFASELGEDVRQIRPQVPFAQG